MSSVHIEWTRHENKLFEIALAEVDPNSPDRFEKIASKVPGKTVEQVQIHYQMLVDDIEMIESDGFPIPDYVQSDNDSDMIRASKKRATSKKEPVNPTSTKGIPWTDEEHRMFLIGLNNCGKGDWRNISRNYVRSRTPTQVASHAQKYYLRSGSGSSSSSNSPSSSAGGTSSTNTTIRERHHRSSIHDIPNRRQADDPQAPVRPIKNTMMTIKSILSPNTNNFIPIAPAPYPSTAALISNSPFSSSSSTARTTTSSRPAPIRRTSTLTPISNFNIGSRTSNPKILNNIGNYGSSSYSPTFMSSSSSAQLAAPTGGLFITSSPTMVPQRQYRPLHDQYPMTIAAATAAGAGGALYGSGTTGYNINNNNNGTAGTCMLMNYQQAPLMNYQQAGAQIQSSPSSYGYNTGLWGDDRSSIGTGSGGGGGVDDHLGPSVAEPAAAAPPPPPPNILMDVDNNSSTISHPYNYDQPIYSPAYDPDLYPAYM